MTSDPEKKELTNELPQPEVPGDAIAPRENIISEAQSAQNIERNVPVTQAPPQQAQQMTNVQPAAVPQQVPQQPGTLDPNGSIPVAPPQIADDVDLIEKEWVDKAKEIVNRTKDNPRLQNKEMTKLKAEYLKRRYDRTIKLDEE